MKYDLNEIAVNLLCIWASLFHDAVQTSEGNYDDNQNYKKYICERSVDYQLFLNQSRVYGIHLLN